MSLKTIKRDVKKLKDDMRKLRPSSAPGVMTSQTTRGVTRRAVVSGTVATGSVIPRWG